MSDIFVSYARSTETRARQLAEALTVSGATTNCLRTDRTRR